MQSLGLPFFKTISKNYAEIACLSGWFVDWIPKEQNKNDAIKWKKKSWFLWVLGKSILIQCHPKQTELFKIFFAVISLQLHLPGFEKKWQICCTNIIGERPPNWSAKKLLMCRSVIRMVNQRFYNWQMKRALLKK